ncbi:hypothetical protein, partial [Pusillimonas noertemannii]|uniref:hypothetical protein n=1 Tax=Pusillimonas noertemannii TaxID=305977 RepID=UPI003341055E
WILIPACEGSNPSSPAIFTQSWLTAIGAYNKLLSLRASPARVNSFLIDATESHPSWQMTDS